MSDSYDDDEFHETYEEIIALTNDLLEEKDVMMVAAVLTTVGMSLYRSTLSEEDYNKVIDVMSNLRNDIAEFETEQEYLH